MNNENIIRNSLTTLEQYIKKQQFQGVDPYDALNSPTLQKLNNQSIKILFTQFLVYSPVNLRNYLNIPQEKNPKALGLLLSAYCNLYKKNIITKTYFNEITSLLTQSLITHRSIEYSNYCWGFNFPWQDIKRYSPKYLPTIVVTTYVSNSFLDLYEITKDKIYLKIAESSAQFILKNLNMTETTQGICFSYTPIDQFLVHNANCLGAAYLSRMYHITKNETYKTYAKKAMEFSCSHQNKDGSWAYSIDPETKKERNQIDFHQGFILDSLIEYIKYTEDNTKEYVSILKKGADFYQTHQFHQTGASKWRLPYNYPIDIHHQAQGIITFKKLADVLNEEKHTQQATKIATWTIQNFQDKNGYFYYQKWPFFTNKIPYMRWGQTWMLMALSILATKKIKITQNTEYNSYPT